MRHKILKYANRVAFGGPAAASYLSIHKFNFHHSFVGYDKLEIWAHRVDWRFDALWLPLYVESFEGDKIIEKGKIKFQNKNASWSSCR